MANRPTPQDSQAEKPIEKKDNVVHLRLPPEHMEALDKIARANGISRAAVISIAVSRLLQTGL